MANIQTCIKGNRRTTRKVKNKEIYGSKLIDYVLETGHDIKWVRSCFLYKESNWRKRN